MKRLQIRESHEFRISRSGDDTPHALARELRGVGRSLLTYADAIDALVRDGWEVKAYPHVTEDGFSIIASKEFASKREAQDRLREIGLDAANFELKVIRE